MFEHSRSHAAFSDMDIIINNGKISTKLYDKCDDFSFFIVIMSNFHTNFLSSIFYETVMSEVFSIARPFSSVVSFYEKSNALITRMEKQWI